jgi:hypothetical protein
MMFEKIFYRLNRRVVLVIACLILLGASFALYIRSQQPVAERLSGDYSWCLFPPSEILSLTFNEDSSFVQRIVTPIGYGATAYIENGRWSIYEEQGKTWIGVAYQDHQLGENQLPIKAFIGSYYLRVEGNFTPLKYRSVNLFRCARRIY